MLATAAGFVAPGQRQIRAGGERLCAADVVQVLDQVSVQVSVQVAECAGVAVALCGIVEAKFHGIVPLPLRFIELDGQCFDEISLLMAAIICDAPKRLI